MSSPTVVTRKELYTWRPAFLEALAETGNVTEAAKLAGIAKQTAYVSYHDDAEFRKAWDIAHLAASVPLEEEARRRAVDGVDEPVFYKGKRVATVKKYSDALLMFLLKGANPDRYVAAVTSHTIVTGADGGPVRTDFGEILAAIRRERQLPEPVDSDGHLLPPPTDDSPLPDDDAQRPAT